MTESTVQMYSSEHPHSVIVGLKCNQTVVVACFNAEELKFNKQKLVAYVNGADADMYTNINSSRYATFYEVSIMNQHKNTSIFYTDNILDFKLLNEDGKTSELSFPLYYRVFDEYRVSKFTGTTVEEAMEHEKKRHRKVLKNIEITEAEAKSDVKSQQDINKKRSDASRIYLQQKADALIGQAEKNKGRPFEFLLDMDEHVKKLEKGHEIKDLISQSALKPKGNSVIPKNKFVNAPIENIDIIKEVSKDCVRKLLDKPVARKPKVNDPAYFDGYCNGCKMINGANGKLMKKLKNGIGYYAGKCDDCGTAITATHKISDLA